MASIARKTFRWLVILLIILVAAELLLHVYNPFEAAPQSIVLSPSKTYTFTNTDYRLDASVTHTKNAYGFRGDTTLSGTGIIAIGGGGTECRFLNDGKDWPSILGKLYNKEEHKFWINNAGISGISSEACLSILQQSVLPLKPRYVLVMTGIDDIALQPEEVVTEDKGFFSHLILPGLFTKVKNRAIARPIPNTARLLKLPSSDTLTLPDSSIVKRLKQEELSLQLYKQHLEKIIELCKANKIKPIFISQPMLYGDDTDPVSSTYLGNIKVGQGVNGKAFGLLLKQYNKVMFETAEAHNCDFINISARMPKDSRYYYDGINFTNEGSEMMAEVLYDETSGIVKAIKESKNISIKE